jgi:hypothetical protein
MTVFGEDLIDKGAVQSRAAIAIVNAIEALGEALGRDFGMDSSYQHRRFGRGFRNGTAHDFLHIAACGIGVVTQLAELILVTAGIFHEPSSIEGSFSFGQYMRSMSWNLPDGAGSQFASLSAPGETFWT